MEKSLCCVFHEKKVRPTFLIVAIVKDDVGVTLSLTRSVLGCRESFFPLPCHLHGVMMLARWLLEPWHQWLLVIRSSRVTHSRIISFSRSMFLNSCHHAYMPTASAFTCTYTTGGKPVSYKIHSLTTRVSPLQLSKLYPLKFLIFGENMDVMSSRLKRKKTKVWVTCTSVKAPLMMKGTYRFWSNICCYPDDV